MGWRLERFLSKAIGSSYIPPEKYRPRQLTLWESLARHPDALAQLIGAHSLDRMRYMVQIGYGPDGTWVASAPQTHTLVLGPPRSAAGKTSGYMIPTILTQGGPVVVYSTKFDLARNTALARSRLGSVWHYDPTGEPAPPGFRELRWSVIGGCVDWTDALQISRLIVAASNTDSLPHKRASNALFFEEKAGDLIAGTLHYAALTNRDMRFVVSRISSQALSHQIHRANRPNRANDGPDYVGMIDELDRLGSTEAADKLDGIIWENERTRGNIFTSADVALRGYQGRAMRSATDTNFNVEKFILGEPHLRSDLYTSPDALDTRYRLPGRYDTIYITVPADLQRLYSPLVIGLLSAIRREVYKKHQSEERSGDTGKRQPVTFVLDEMYGCPLPDLPKLLSEGGGQGLLICGALQSLSQAVAVWGDVGKSMLDLWQNVLALPGIRDGDTIELLSKLIGEHHETYWTEGWSESINHMSHKSSRDWVQTRTEHVERVRRMPPDRISRGNPSDPSEVLHYKPNGGWGQLKLMKYWADQPWPGILLQSTEHSIKSPGYRYPDGYMQDTWALPLPNLAQGRNYDALYRAGGNELVHWFMNLRRQWNDMQDPESSEPPLSLEG